MRPRRRHDPRVPALDGARRRRRATGTRTSASFRTAPTRRRSPPASSTDARSPLPLGERHRRGERRDRDHPGGPSVRGRPDLCAGDRRRAPTDPRPRRRQHRDREAGEPQGLVNSTSYDGPTNSDGGGPCFARPWATTSRTPVDATARPHVGRRQGEGEGHRVALRRVRAESLPEHRTRARRAPPGGGRERFVPLGIPDDGSRRRGALHQRLQRPSSAT